MGKYRKRRFYRKRKPWYHYKNMGGYAKTAVTALAIAKQVKDMVNVEYKALDNTASPNMTTTYQVDNLNVIPTGDTSSGRDGDKVRCKSILIQGNVKQNASATQTTCTFGLLLWKRPNGNTLAPSDVFKENSTYSPRTIAKMQDYKILCRWTYSFSSTGSRVRAFKKYLKVNIPMKYDGSLGTIAQQMENGLYLFYMSDEVTNVPEITYYTRIRYLDN